MTDKKTRVLSNLLSLVLGAGIGAGSYAIKEQIRRGGNERIEQEAPTELDGGGVIISESESQGMQLTASKLSSSEYAENGVSTQAESAYTLTATVKPEDAENKAVDWSIAFVNASSAWASGKSVTDYVTVTPSADGALTAVVTNLGEFGEQIKVTVTSRGNPSAKAECTVDYIQKVIEPYLTIGEIECVKGGVTEVEFETEVVGNGPGGVIDFGARLSEVYTIEAEIPTISLDVTYTFFFEGTGENIDFHLIVNAGDGYSLYFDRRLFMDDPENGREVYISGEPVSEEQVNEWKTADIIRMLLEMPSDPLILGYSFYTEQSGTVNFETQIQITIAEESQVQKVSLDKGALKF